MRLISYIDPLVFSSDLKDISVENGDNVNVTIIDSGNRVSCYSTVIQPFATVAVLESAGDIVEAYMRKENLAFAEFEFNFRSTGDDDEYLNFSQRVIFSQANVHVAALDWVENYFLTRLDTRSLAKQQPASLAFYAVEGQDITPEFSATLRYEDAVRVVKFSSQEAVTADYTGAHFIDCDYDSIKSRLLVHELANMVDIDEERAYEFEMVAWSVRVGERYANFYLEDVTPSMKFEFKNNFNVNEIVWLQGILTAKPALDKSEAVVSGVSRLYDCKVNSLFEFVAAPMPLHLAKALEDLVIARDLWITLPDVKNTSQQVIVDSAELLVSDDNANFPSLKLTWKFADGKPHLFIPPFSQEVFSSHFDKSFS